MYVYVCFRARISIWLSQPFCDRENVSSNGVQRIRIRSDGRKETRGELETVKSVGNRLAICLEWYVRPSPIGRIKFQFPVKAINSMANYSTIM